MQWNHSILKEEYIVNPTVKDATKLQNISLTFDTFGDRRRISAPRWISVRREVPELEVADAEPDDRGLVQLGSNGGRQGKHLGQLVKLVVLLAPTRPRCVP